MSNVFTNVNCYSVIGPIYTNSCKREWVSQSHNSRWRCSREILKLIHLKKELKIIKQHFSTSLKSLYRSINQREKVYPKVYHPFNQCENSHLLNSTVPNGDISTADNVTLDVLSIKLDQIVSRLNKFDAFVERALIITKY